MEMKTFDEFYELAYDVRTDHERQHGQWDRWYHQSIKDFEKKPLQRAYKLFTKKGTFRRDQGDRNRDDMITAAHRIREHLTAPVSSHQFAAAISELSICQVYARDCSEGYRHVQERMVVAPAFLRDMRPYMRKLAKVWDGIVEKYAAPALREFTIENVNQLREDFEDVYAYERDDGTKNYNGAWKLADKCRELAHGVHRSPDRYPLYFLDADHEPSFTYIWDAWDRREDFINNVDKLQRQAEKALELTKAATTNGELEDARVAVQDVRNFIYSGTFRGTARWLTYMNALHPTKSDDAWRKRKLWDAYNQVKTAARRWDEARNALNAASHGSTDDLDNAINVVERAVEGLSGVRSARYKIHQVGEVPMWKSWVVNQFKNAADPGGFLDRDDD